MEKQKLHSCPCCGSSVSLVTSCWRFVRCNNTDCEYSGPLQDANGAKHNNLCRLVDLGKEYDKRMLMFAFSFPPDLGWKNKKEASSMNQKGSTNAVVGAIKMLESLQEAVKDAGGTPERYSVDELKNMTAMDLIAQLGCNGIQFCSGKAERV